MTAAQATPPPISSALYAQVSDIYLRDVGSHITLTFVRIWETPDDLFNTVDPSPLTEFRNYWNANMGGVPRDVAQLISGRRDYPFGGQASLSAICGSSAYGVVGYMVGSFPDPTTPTELLAGADYSSWLQRLS